MNTATALSTEARLQIIAEAHRRALARRTLPPPQKKNEAEMDTVLTDTQLSILKKGMDYKTFALTRQQAGKASGMLKNRGLIVSTGKKGEYTLTPEGKDLYQTHLAQEAAANDQVYVREEGGINLEDPALKADPELHRLTALVARQTRIIQDNEATIDELMQQISGLTRQMQEMSAATQADERIDWYERVIVPLLAVAGVKPEILRDDPQWLVVWANGLKESVSIEEQLADERARLIEQKNSRIDALSRCIDELKIVAAEWERRAKGTDQERLLALILNDLAGRVPAIEHYVAARLEAEVHLTAITMKGVRNGSA